jgi:hypothetical protein
MALNDVLSSALNIIQLGNTSTNIVISDSYIDTIEYIKQSLLNIGEIVSEDMVIGESDVIFYSSNMKMPTSLQYTSLNITVTSPLTSLESYQDIIPQSFTMLPLINSNAHQYTSITMLTISTSAYGNNSLFSDNMIIDIADSTNSNNFVVIMQTNNKSVYSINDINESLHYVDTICEKGVEGPVTVTGCPNTKLGDIVIYCNGTAGVMTTKCPYFELQPSCVSLQFSDVICRAIDHSDFNVTCHCTLEKSKSTHLTSDRTLQDKSGSNDDYIVAHDGSGESTIEFSTMIKSVATNNFIQTWSSADNLTASELLHSWKVLATVCSIFTVVVAALLFSIDADKSVSISPQKDHLPMASTRGLTNPTTSKMIKHVSEELQMVEETLPMVFRTIPLLEKFTHEAKKYHKWLGIWFYYSPNFLRVLRVISLSTSVIAMLFIQAVTYNIAKVDDGSCESYVDSTGCWSEVFLGC